MAPIVCLPGHSAGENSQSYSRRRHQNQDGSINKRQSAILKRWPWATFPNSETSPHPSSSPSNRTSTSNPASTSNPTSPIDSSVPIDLSIGASMRMQSMQNEQWKKFLRHELLLDVWHRTLALERSNEILQKKLDALREETNNYLASLRRNQENKNIKVEDLSSGENNVVSSSTEISSSSPSPSPSFPKVKIESDSNFVSSTTEVDTREDTDC